MILCLIDATTSVSKSVDSMKFIIKHLAQSILSIALAATLSNAAQVAPMVSGVNGDYKIINLKGSVKLGPDTTTIPPETVQELINSGEKITIQNGRFSYNRADVVAFVNSIGPELGGGFKAKVTGPTSVRIAKKGTIYSGKSASPLVVSFSATESGVKITGQARFGTNVTVKGDILTIVVPISGQVSGNGKNVPLSGKITVTAARSSL
jgi:hypothetical protein